MSDSFNVVLLAAGKGTRLKIETPKPLCLALGQTLVEHVIDGINDFKGEDKELNFGIVVGHKKDEVQSHIQNSYSKIRFDFAHQKEQLGTGHALQVFFNDFRESFKTKYTFVTCADTPLIHGEIYQRLYEKIIESGAEAVCATFELEDPTGYGRIDEGENGFSIVEQKDASDEQRKIKKVNSGLYLFETQYIQKHINSLDDNNKSGEFYLTDLFSKEANVVTCNFKEASDFIGVNNLIQLSEAENFLREKKINNLLLSGVQIQVPSSVFIEKTVEIEPGSFIEPNVRLMGKTFIGKDSHIETGCVLKDVRLEKKVRLKAYSYLEGASVGANSQIGPMARLREGSKLGADVKIGNFVETKKAELENGVKVSHLSYVGDAEIGENTNIGCGFITCNYDGAHKHKTKIGKDSFIGSDCQMVAPIELGERVYIGSGSTINQDVPSDAFAIARQRQVTKEGMSKKFIKKK